MTIAELRALLSRATPGPLRAKSWMVDQAQSRVLAARGQTVATFLNVNQTDANEDGEGPANRDLYIAAVNALPMLLDAVEAAKQLRECLHFVFNMDLGRTEGTALNHARASFDAAVARLGSDRRGT